MKLTATCILVFLSLSAAAQLAVKGLLTDPQHQPLPGATVTLSTPQKKWSQLTTTQGEFSFTVPTPGRYWLRAQAVGKKNLEQSIEVSTRLLPLTLVLADQDLSLEPLEVRAVRASDQSPFTKTNISKQEIAQTNLGQDLPFLLSQTPSAVVSSDAGNGIGYTSIRIRGSDATRINVTMNGIPYNDAESQGSYFVDIPDLVSSASSIQVQRGVGTSTNGAGAFGATINLSTNEFLDKPSAAANNSYGSFNTWKNTVKVGSGLLNEHFTLDARLSRISSDGYIDRASTRLQSLYLSGAYMAGNTSVRFNLITGKEKTYQAWYGVPQRLLATQRTYNPAGTEKPGSPYNNETDNYQQDHYQLFVNHAFRSNWSMSIASFLTRGRGYYEEYKAAQAFADYGLPPVTRGTDTIATDLVRQLWLDNYFYGQVFSVQRKTAVDELTFGGGWNRYQGKHYGVLVWGETGIPKDDRYYDYPAVKTDVNLYAKWLHQLGSGWNAFGDIQYRRVLHRMNGFDGLPDLFIQRSFHFVNPKAGISYHQNGLQLYLSYALANKEPNRDDFQAGTIQQPKKEMLHDVELGAEKKNKQYSWGATLYYMHYKDQLVLTGKLNDVGAYTRINVPNSYRLGLELQGMAAPAPWFSISANFSISRNRIQSFTEYLDDYDNSKQVAVPHNHTAISFSPAVVAGGSIQFIPCKTLEITLPAKYVSRQYLDNTQNNNRSLNGYYTQDLRASWKIGRLLYSQWNLIAQVNNVFNRKYEPNGATYPYISGGTVVNDNYYYPMAGTHFLVALNVQL